MLAHGAVGVFVSHGDYNSAREHSRWGANDCEAIFGDHMPNGRMVEDVWEIGMIVKGEVFTKNGIMRNLDIVLAQEKGKKMREVKEFAQRAVGAK